MAIAKAPVVSGIWDTERESLFSSESYFLVLAALSGEQHNDPLGHGCFDVVNARFAPGLAELNLDLAQRGLR